MGFNLLAGSMGQLGYYSNQLRKIQMLNPGLYGLSNHLLDTPWPKVQKAKNNLENILQHRKITERALFDLLADKREAPEDQLPDTGIPKDIEKKVSSIFIKSDGYGTRCSTIMLIERNGKVTFTERRFKAGTLDISDENRYEFSITESTR
jgi:uncharacterized protein with NRDE domain